MPKRTWTQAYQAEAHNGTPCPHDNSQPPSTRHHPGDNAGPRTAPGLQAKIQSSGSNDRTIAEVGDHSNPPAISRRIKACSACRKLKIKCLIDEGGEPCRRCAKHSLKCVVNKNLQTIIDEKTQFVSAFAEDLHHMHSLLRTLAEQAGLPEPNALLTTTLRDTKKPATHPAEDDSSLFDVDHSVQQDSISPELRRDETPDLEVEEDPSLPQVPIQSLYALTKLNSLRSQRVLDGKHSVGSNDLITRGIISEKDAERLFLLYRDRLDAFVFAIGGRYRTLKETRSRCTILTTTILTVAALHDVQSNDLYEACSKELRRLVSMSMFDRCTSRDYLRAMCVASFWLGDISWMISGHAIRRASECNLHNQLSQAVEQQDEEAADGARLWLILRVCDQRLATLYGRPALMHEDPSPVEIESFLQSPLSNAQDRRLMGQVSLLGIFKSIRELFGPDKGKPIHRAYLHQVSHFNKQLDNWYSHWSNTVPDNFDHIGPFPRKAVTLHYQFAKLHLHSHVFRGLSASQPIPHYFMDCTVTAINAASAVINYILSDTDVSASTVGIPSYLHCMTAFACTFLVKVAVKYGKALIEPDYVWDITTRLVQHFKSIPAGKWHLTKLMGPGLERLAALLDPVKNRPVEDISPSATHTLGASIPNFELSGSDNFMSEFEANFMFDYSMNLGFSPIFPLSGGNYLGEE